MIPRDEGPGLILYQGQWFTPTEYEAYKSRQLAQNTQPAPAPVPVSSPPPTMSPEELQAAYNAVESGQNSVFGKMGKHGKSYEHEVLNPFMMRAPTKNMSKKGGRKR
jgi:hypothetical protein